jgi:hypothetical protein
VPRWISTILADQALEDLPDHRKMRLMPSELLVQIDEVTRRRIQPLCEQPRDEKGDLRVGSEKALRIVEEINLRRSSRRHGDRGGRSNEYRAQLLDRGDVNVAP